MVKILAPQKKGGGILEKVENVVEVLLGCFIGFSTWVIKFPIKFNQHVTQIHETVWIFVWKISVF